MNNRKLNKDNKYTVFAILVTYEPDEDLLYQNVSAIVSQVDQVVIVDNGSSCFCKFSQQLRKFKKVFLIDLSVNLGIAAAFNIGIKYVQQNGVKYVILLDQDSIASKNMVQDLIVMHNQLTQAGYRVSAVGPRFYDRSNGSISTPVTYSFLGTMSSKNILEQFSAIAVNFLISSGSLILTSIFEDVGIMRESLFIDFVDTEWILRSERFGYRAFMHDKVYMTHARGEHCKRIWLGRWRYFPINKPFRYYYLFRNALLLMADPVVSFKWKVLESQRLIRITLVILLYSEKKISTLRYIVMGICDGFRGRYGKIPTSYS